MMIEEQQTNTLNEGKPVRPVKLTVLCILTFIGSGLNLFSSLIISGFHDLFLQLAQEFGEKFKMQGLEILAQMTVPYFLVTGIFYAGSLVGAVFMMNLKKIGFHIYTISQILLVISPMYFLHMQGPGIPELIFSGLFVILYSTNLKFMS